MTAFQASQVSVGDTVTELVSGLEGRYQIKVKIAENVAVYLGDSDVSGSNGYPLSVLEIGENGYPVNGTEVSLDVNLDSTDVLYAVSASGTVPVYVMVSPR